MTAPLLNATAQKSQRLSLVMLSLFIFLLLTSLSSKANDQTGDPALIIVPSYEHPLVSRYLPGSKRTLVAPALVSRSGEITYLTPNDISAPEAWDRFIKLAKELSSLQLATLDPEMIRDEHGVIQMAVIHSDKPITAALILLPGFLDHFSAIFGPELLITIPTQNKICVFPKLANHLPQLTEAIRDDYLISSAQASTEIFELNRNGLHAVGSIDPDDE